MSAFLIRLWFRFIFCDPNVCRAPNVHKIQKSKLLKTVRLGPKGVLKSFEFKFLSRSCMDLRFSWGLFSWEPCKILFRNRIIWILDQNCLILFFIWRGTFRGTTHSWWTALMNERVGIRFRCYWLYYENKQKANFS